MHRARDAVGPRRPGPPKREELSYRLHQQSVLAQFGRRALTAGSVEELLEAAVRLCADGMGARFAKALEYMPEQEAFLLRAGIGWKPGYVGHELVGEDSPPGYAFRTGSPVISNHLQDEERFRTPRLLAEHGVVRTLSVPVPRDHVDAWGALGADSPDESGRFDEADIEFMVGMARVLGIAIERQEARTERERIRRELEESRAILATTVDSVDQIVWGARPDGHHDFFNSRWYDFTGTTPGEAAGEGWAELFHPDDREQAFARWRRSLETGEPYEAEFRLRHRSGAYRWMLGRASPVRGEAGVILRWIGTSTDIEAQKKSGERFRLLYEAQTGARLVLTPDFTVEDASEAWLQATLQKREAVVGRPLFEVMPENPNDPAATGARNLRASLRRVLATRAADRMPVQRYDVRLPGDGFEVRWWAPLNSPVLGDDGEVSHIVHQVEDVTAEMLERQRAAEAEAGEARFRAVAETIPGLVFEADPEGRFTYVNARLAAFSGKTLPAGRQAWLDVVHPDDRARVAAAWTEAVRTERAFEVDCRLGGTDGTSRWFMLRASPLRDAEGRVEKWIGVGSDVDVAKRAEGVLRESEAQFRSMAESLPQLAWMADPTGRVHWYNQRWYDYTGTSPEEMRRGGWRQLQHPDHAERVLARLQHAWDTGEAWEDTFPLRGADGRYRWFLSRAEPLRDAGGRVTQWFGTNTDVTEQKEAAELQRTLLQEVSHRVKNSLALVSSLLALQARPMDGEGRRALEEASARVHAVARVHDQLWRGAGARHIDLAPFLCDLGAAVGATAPRHATVCSAEPAFVSADMAVPLGLFVNELLTNAYKYAYPDGEGGEVRLSGTRLADGRYRLEVSDSGCGLPADFDLTAARRSLGMQVITSLARQLDGVLSAGSAEPGARFTLEFPLKTE